MQVVGGRGVEAHLVLLPHEIPASVEGGATDAEEVVGHGLVEVLVPAAGHDAQDYRAYQQEPCFADMVTV